MKRLFAMACFVLSLTSTWGGNAAHAQEPYLGEIRLFGYNWCPRGWQQANGAILSISQNTALFSLYGTNFGGNGVSTFGLPNLSGSAPYGQQGGGRSTPVSRLRPSTARPASRSPPATCRRIRTS
jgi:hypothetical protein